MDCGCGSSRREFLSRAGTGFGMLALASILKQEKLLAQDASRPLAPRMVHFTPRAKSVIFLFMSGGPSHVDLFDYKPELIRPAASRSPSRWDVHTRRAVARTSQMPPRWAFRKYGECGAEISDALPNIASMADDLRPSAAATARR